MRLEYNSEKPLSGVPPKAGFWHHYRFSSSAMILLIAAVIAGLVLLTYGADRFVAGAAALACNLGVAPLIIGLTILGFGTSAPEILVAVVAALDGSPAMAIGNALGSNITNMALVLGATVVICPLTVHSGILRREYPLMLAAMLLALGLMGDDYLGRVDAVIMLIAMTGMILVLVRIALRQRSRDPLLAELEQELPGAMTTRRALLWLVVGLMLLLGGSHLLVWGAERIALALGVSQLVIGLTVVAIGTSLPELAASVVSAMRGEPDMAMGNIIGSNIFNSLAVLAMPGLIAPGGFDASVLDRDFPVMLGLGILLYVLGMRARGQGRIQRWQGGLLLLAFGAYEYLIYLQEVAAS